MAQNNVQHFFPRYIDRPRLIGIFEMDEFFLAFFIMVAILAASLAFPNISSLIVMIVAIVTGGTSAKLYSKFKKNRPDGFTLQKLYRKGFFSPSMDDKKAFLKYPYLSKMGPVVPFGFTNELYN